MSLFHAGQLSDKIHQTFGYRPRQFQLVATESICAGKDTVVVAPTGSGKSLLFDAPLLVNDAQKEAMVVIVSPLKALQVEQAQKHTTSIFVNSDNKDASVLQAIKEKQYKRIYLAPEQLQTTAVKKLLNDSAWTKDVLAYIVDEAHVVLQWGGTFRPVYQTLADLRHLGSRRVPILAATATLSKRMYKDLAGKLELRTPTVINIGCKRPNIFLRVQPFRHPIKGHQDVLSVLPELRRLRKGDHTTKLVKTILYVNDKKQGRELYELLNDILEQVDLKGAVTYHHASASEKHRRKAEEGLRDGSFRWVIATDALGMGADIPDILRVVQVRAGESAGACLQRLGRAGRDGQTPTEGIVLFEKALLKQKPPKQQPEGEVNPVKAKSKKKTKGTTIDDDWLAILRAQELSRARGLPY